MLTVENVVKIFGEGTPSEKTALHGVSLHLKPGDFVTVIGGNGSGKSTLLNLIAGVFIPDAGRITIDGFDVTDAPEYRRAALLGRVFQDPLMGSAGDMTIEENLAIAELRGSTRTLRRGLSKNGPARYREILAELDLGLEDRMGSKVGLLSGGQRQALTLLMATLRSPKLLLLDEHTAALDPKTAAKVLELSDRLICESRLTTLMVTHNMRDALEHGNRIIMMSEGNIIYDECGREKKRLTVADLYEKFSVRTGAEELYR